MKEAPLVEDNLITKAHDQVDLGIDIDLVQAQKARGTPKFTTTPSSSDRKRPAPPVQKKTLSVEDYKRRRGIV